LADFKPGFKQSYFVGRKHGFAVRGDPVSGPIYGYGEVYYQRGRKIWGRGATRKRHSKIPLNGLRNLCPPAR